MTEEIIIDGVDVSECVSFDKLNGLNICCYDDTREDKIPFTNFCIENKDCSYKQLKRKEQDCEQLKAENETLKQHFKQIDLTNKILYEEKINFLDLINKLVKYCLNCNLKADSTACEILNIIERDE